MTLPGDPVFIDPYDEGYYFAKENKVNVGILARPAEFMAESMAYSAHDWRRFRQGALKALLETSV
jgi:hypothetical protein